MAPLGMKDLFVIFLKAGMAFGGGLGILSVLEGELVTKRKALTREEFLTDHALGRVVPSGTMTALAVAFGTRFAGVLGSIVALEAMILPAFTLSAIFSTTYVALTGTAFLDVVSLTILPAALAFIAAALRLGRDITIPSFEALLATAAFVGAIVYGSDSASGVSDLAGPSPASTVPRGRGGGTIHTGADRDLRRIDLRGHSQLRPYHDHVCNSGNCLRPRLRHGLCREVAPDRQPRARGAHRACTSCCCPGGVTSSQRRRWDSAFERDGEGLPSTIELTGRSRPATSGNAG